MSGVTGSNRITRDDFMGVVREYEQNILSKIEGYKGLKVSGSFNSDMSKNSFGDIDLIVHFETDMDKKDLKKFIIKQMLKHSEDLVLPFQSEKYKGRRYYNSGEIVTISYPQPQGSVQIDNIVALSDHEVEFKKHFLDLTAEKQGLLLGLVKIASQQEESIFTRLNIEPQELEDGEEYEFNLSSVELQLRAIKMKEVNGKLKTASKRVLWRSNDWSYVETILDCYDVAQPFEKLLSQVDKQVLDNRSRGRIVGLFCSMVSVKSGEVGTPKGARKEETRKKIQELLDNQH